MRRLLLAAVLALAAVPARADWLGDVPVGATVYGNFTTLSTTGLATLGGTPVLSSYKASSVTQSTCGYTLNVDLDGIAGYNNFALDTSCDGSFYASGSRIAVVITTGTVAGQSRVGYVVAEFCIECGSSLRPTTSGRTLDVSAGGEAGVDWANVGSPTTTVNLSGTTISAVTSGVTVSTNNDKTGYRLSATGVDDVWDEPIAGHLTAGTTGEALSAAGSAGDPWASTCASFGDGTIGAFLCALDQSEIEPVSPILNGGVLELVAGDAYDADHGRSLDDFALTGQPSLTGATVTFVIDGVLSVTATSVSGAGGATQTPIFELTAAQTALLTRTGTATATAGPYRYQIQATWAADTPSQPATLARGFITVIKRASGS